MHWLRKVLCFAALALSLQVVHVASERTLQQLLDEAKEHVVASRFNDALNSFEGALALDPNNYQTYYRRAVTYLTMGKFNNAIRDLGTVLQLNPKFTAALFQRGKQLLKECKLDEALMDLQQFKTATPSDSSVDELIGEALEAKQLMTELPNLVSQRPNDQAIEALSKLITTCPLLAELRLKRADVYLLSDDKEMAINDLSRAAKLQPDSTDVLYRVAVLRMAIGEPAEAMFSIKECLKFDPEHKMCKQMFRDFKKLDKSLKKIEALVEASNWHSVVRLLTDANDGYCGEAERLNARVLMQKGYALSCRGYIEIKDGAKAMPWCSKAIELDENDGASYCNRGDAKIMLEEYQDALRDFERAHQINNQDRRAREGYQKAQRLLQAAGRKDYYKILGVARDASKRDIKKAYRKLAQEWHPDKYKGDLTKEQVLKKMSDINEAYETLSDDESRAKVDNGEDPNAQQQPFHHGQNPFFHQHFGGFGGFPGGGGQQFHFRFQ